MTIEYRRDAELTFVGDTAEQKQRTIDAAVAEALESLQNLEQKLDALEAKYEATEKAKYFNALRRHLDERCSRADFFQPIPPPSQRLRAHILGGHLD